MERRVLIVRLVRHSVQALRTEVHGSFRLPRSQLEGRIVSATRTQEDRDVVSRTSKKADVCGELVESLEELLARAAKRA